MDEDDFETGDFIPDEPEGDFKTPLGENEDAASDDDELGPQPKRFRSDSESTTASGTIFRIFLGQTLVRFRKTPFKSGNFGYVSHLVKPSESLKLYQGASCCYNRPLKSKERCFYEFEILNFIKCIFVGVRRYFRSRQGR